MIKLNYVRLYLTLQNLLRRFTGVKAHTISWEKLELVSIHIPKTAGTSFFHALKDQYGPKNLVRMDIKKKDGSIRVNKIDYKNSFAYKTPKAVHGHFSIIRLKNNFTIDDQVPVITWLRNPVDRVISNYYYLSKRLDEELNEQKEGLDILSKIKRSLIEFAADEMNQNRMTKFLEGMKLEDLFFIGIVENYDSDIYELGKKLGWNNISLARLNKTGKKYKEKVPEEIRDLIRSYNQQDFELYQKALEFRGINPEQLKR